MKKATKKGASSKKSSVKKSVSRKTSSSTSKTNRNIEKILIENFISMQKILTSNVEKMAEVSKKLTEFLNLFEGSAKALAEKEVNLEFKSSADQKEVIDKLKTILDQNKLIAKGLTLMHETASNTHSYYPLNKSNVENSSQKQMLPSMQQNKSDFSSVSSPIKPKAQEGDKSNFSI